MENFTRSAMTLKDPEPIGDNAYSVTIFANEMARDGISIDPSSIDFSNYEKNPVVLYAHDFMGRTESARTPHRTHPQARPHRRRPDQGRLRVPRRRPVRRPRP